MVVANPAAARTGALSALTTINRLDAATAPELQRDPYAETYQRVARVAADRPANFADPLPK